MRNGLERQVRSLRGRIRCGLVRPCAGQLRGPGAATLNGPSLDTGTRAALDEAALLADAVAEADGVDAKRKRSRRGGGADLSFASSLSGRISGLPAMRKPRLRATGTAAHIGETAERVFEERSGESIGELSRYAEGGLRAPGGERCARALCAAARGYGVLGEAAWGG